MKYNSWHADYLNLWDTYKPWWISIIVIAPVLALIATIINGIAMIDIEDIFDEIGFYIGIGISSIIPLAITFFTNTNWFPVFIVLIGIVGFVLLWVIGLGLNELELFETAFEGAAVFSRAWVVPQNLTKEGRKGLYRHKEVNRGYRWNR